MLHRELLVNGIFLGGVCDQGTGKEVITSPIDGSVIGTVAEAGWTEVDSAIHAASATFQTWRKSAPAERAALLTRIADSLRDRRTELADLLTIEIGKPSEAGLAEVDRARITFLLAADEALQLADKPVDLGQDPRGQNYTAAVRRDAIGVVFAITPYNWPINLAAHKIAPTIAMGGTMVLKGSGRAALSTLTLARIIHESSCPPGVFNAVHCAPALAEKACKDPRVKRISFTGSADVGWKLKGMVPTKNVTLELGGTAPIVVMPDADLEVAARLIASSATAYAGQICISAQNVFVHESILQPFQDLLASQMGAVTYGDPRQPGITVGPLISADAASVVESKIQEAIAEGWALRAGGGRDGNIIQPTLLVAPSSLETGRGSASRIFCEEAFAPVLTITGFSDLNRLTAHLNASPYSIHASIFSKDRAHIQQFTDDVETGGIVINDAPSVRFDALPYGGVRMSGFGREGGHSGCWENTSLKSIVERKTTA